LFDTILAIYFWAVLDEAGHFIFKRHCRNCLMLEELKSNQREDCGDRKAPFEETVPIRRFLEQ
jgi:hypothetical protein